MVISEDLGRGGHYPARSGPNRRIGQRSWRAPAIADQPRQPPARRDREGVALEIGEVPDPGVDLALRGHRQGGDDQTVGGDREGAGAGVGEPDPVLASRHRGEQARGSADRGAAVQRVQPVGALRPHRQQGDRQGLAADGSRRRHDVDALQPLDGVRRAGDLRVRHRLQRRRRVLVQPALERRLRLLGAEGQRDLRGDRGLALLGNLPRVDAPGAPGAHARDRGQVAGTDRRPATSRPGNPSVPGRPPTTSRNGPRSGAFCAP